MHGLWRGGDSLGDSHHLSHALFGLMLPWWEQPSRFAGIGRFEDLQTGLCFGGERLVRTLWQLAMPGCEVFGIGCVGGPVGWMRGLWERTLPRHGIPRRQFDMEMLVLAILVG